MVLPPPTVTSSAIAKSLVAGFFQSVRGTVTVCWPTARAHLGTVANEIVALAGGVSEGVAAVERGDLSWSSALVMSAAERPRRARNRLSRSGSARVCSRPC